MLINGVKAPIRCIARRGIICHCSGHFLSVAVILLLRIRVTNSCDKTVLFCNCIPY